MERDYAQVSESPPDGPCVRNEDVVPAKAVLFSRGPRMPKKQKPPPTGEWDVPPWPAGSLPPRRVVLRPQLPADAAASSEESRLDSLAVFRFFSVPVRNVRRGCEGGGYGMELNMQIQYETLQSGEAAIGNDEFLNTVEDLCKLLIYRFTASSCHFP